MTDKNGKGIGAPVNREVEHLKSHLTTSRVYSVGRARNLNASAKGPVVKLKASRVALAYIRCHIIVSTRSLGVVAARMKMKGMGKAVCENLKSSVFDFYCV